MLLAYAVLVRANAVFAVVPLALAWAGWGRGPAARAALAAAATLAVLAVSPLVNHGLLGARASHVERVLPIFDLVGIAHFGGSLPPRTDAAAWAAVERGRCYSPYLWDALGDEGRCGFVADRLGLQGANGDHLIGEWARTVVAHPLAYAAHRLAHLNATLRWLVPFGQPNAGPPPNSQPNSEGLGARATWRTEAPAGVARALAATPLGWPAVWLAASLGLWWTAAAAPRSPARDLALAAFVSASAMMLSFTVVSIASDLRYHLWAMVATTLGGVMLSVAPGVPRRRVVATGRRGCHRRGDGLCRTDNDAERSLGMTFDDYAEHDATGLAALVATGQVTPAELLDTAIAATEAANPALNFVAQPLFDRARAAASRPFAGPFAGVPFMVKDLHMAIAGERSGEGSRLFDGYRPDYTSTLFERFAAAGLQHLRQDDDARVRPDGDDRKPRLWPDAQPLGP